MAAEEIVRAIAAATTYPLPDGLGFEYESDPFIRAVKAAHDYVGRSTLQMADPTLRPDVQEDAVNCCESPASAGADVADVTIRVWRFEDAPLSFRRLSPHGGDEDWLAYVPDALRGEWIPWMAPGSAFGCCDVSEHEVAGGRVLIGAHA